jgi:hypothetical protein
MPETTGSENPTIATARKQFFDGLVDTGTLAQILCKSPQSIGRMISAGLLPYIRFGNKNYFKLDEVRAAILSRADRRNPPPRSPGRPRKTVSSA